MSDVESSGIKGPEASTYNLIEMTDIRKEFPGILALDDVDFSLRAGEVHALLGENGAGKSTLIKVLSGAQPCEGGKIFISGEEIELSDPRIALSKGLRFIYQEINLVPDIDIARNIFLGAEPTSDSKIGLVDKLKLYQHAAELLKKFHIDLNPRTVVSDLSVTQQKMVEIARALISDAKVIILDEPTDVLEDRSRNDLFDVIRKLKQEQNVGFVYISHRYQEVYEIGDRVTILRDGCNVGTWSIDDLSLDQLIEKLVGGETIHQFPALPAPREENALKVDKLFSGPRCRGISFDMRKGEILGVTGLMGAGKTELGRALAGIDLIKCGEIHIHGDPVGNQSPRPRINDGIVYLTEDRKQEGLITDQSIGDNYALASIDRFTSYTLVSYKEIDAEVDVQIKAFNIKTGDRSTLAGHLSGGNQQKLMLAKWLSTQAKLFIIDEPTRGIDIKGRFEVYRFMVELLNQGVSILMLTSDYAEALAMSHRIMILYRGAIADVVDPEITSEEQVLKIAVGAEA